MDFINLPTQGEVISRPPVTEIYLCAGIEWKSDYQHCRLFANESSLLSHVISKCPTRDRPYHITDATPISTGQANVKIPEVETRLMNLNYIAFNNRGFVDRWFFAFITDIVWLSDNSATIKFEMDVFQNCAYRANYYSCYIEQSHIPKANDVRYSNLYPVNIETGESKVRSREQSKFGNWNICFYVTEGTTGAPFGGDVSNNVYRTGTLWSCALGDYERANSLVAEYTEANKKDALLTCFMAPDLCVNALQGTSQQVTNVDMPANVFDGYVPKNEKVYSYPWVYVMADNNEGKTGIYQFEYSGGADPNRIAFQSFGIIATLPAVYTAPLNYKGASPNQSEAMINNGFPLCAWSTDSFQAWIAQNKGSLALGAVGTLAKMGAGAVGVATGNVGGGARAFASSFQDIGSQVAQIYDKEREPRQAHGKFLSENVNAALGLSRVDYYVMSCSGQFAKIADDYFTMFGYPIREIQTPNLNARPYWNYIKTVGANFTGDFQPDMIKKFNDIFDHGVTIWHVNDIGNYGRVNQ